MSLGEPNKINEEFADDSVAKAQAKKRPNPRISLVAGLLGGLIFGFTSAVIAGAGTQIAAAFHIGAVGLSIVTAALLVGALAGALVADPVQRRFGSRAGLVAAGLFVIAGSTLSGLVPTSMLALLVLARFMVGVGVGLVSVVAPMYLAEIAPARIRGAIVSSYQLLLCIGILGAYVVGFAFSGRGDGWRLMFSLGAVPAIALIAAVVKSVDTPAYLIRMGRHQEARALVAGLEPDADPDAIVASLRVEAEAPRARWSAVVERRERSVLTIALVLAIAQILTGINAIMYYAPQIFADVGFGSGSDAIIATVIVGFVNVLGTLIAVKLADRLGRRPLLIVGLSGMTAAAAVVGVTASLGVSGGSAGYVTLIAVLMFVLSFAMSMGPLVWVLISEIFPAHIRSKGVSLSIAMNWTTNIIVSLGFLVVMTTIGTGPTFAIFGVLSLLTLFFIIRKLPETRGKTLEEIEAELHTG